MIDGEIEPHEYAEWIRGYFKLYRWALRMARAAHARRHMDTYQAWKREACEYLAKRHRHIMAQETSKKDR